MTLTIMRSRAGSANFDRACPLTAPHGGGPRPSNRKLAAQSSKAAHARTTMSAAHQRRRWRAAAPRARCRFDRRSEPATVSTEFPWGRATVDGLGRACRSGGSVASDDRSWRSPRAVRGSTRARSTQEVSFVQVVWLVPSGRGEAGHARSPPSRCRVLVERDVVPVDESQGRRWMLSAALGRVCARSNRGLINAIGDRRCGPLADRGDALNRRAGHAVHAPCGAARVGGPAETGR